MRWLHRAPVNSPPLDIFGELKSAQKILIVPSDRVGGLFLAGPAYKLIRNAYPQAYISLFVHSAQANMARQIPFIDEVYSAELGKPIWSGAFKAVGDALRREEFDLAFCLGTDCSFRLAQLCAVCGARIRVGFGRCGIEPFNIEIKLSEESRYEVASYQSMLELLGLGGEAELVWQFAEGKAEQVRTRYLGEEGAQVIGVDLGRGAGRGLTRRQLEDIVGRIVERGFRALLFFSLAEHKQVNYLKETYGNRAVLFEQEDFLTAAALLQSCKTLISCNTDLLHLAVSLKIPTVGIFEENPQRWIAAENTAVETVHHADLRTLNITQIVDALDNQLRGK
jgi:ADP-heptose:LPS heptosyltransferase